MTPVLSVDHSAANDSQAPALFVADGDQDLCDLYRLYFSRRSWRVETSGDGLECLAQLRQATPQVLILDLQLLWGGADGLLSVMRDDAALAEIPVIRTSTDALPDADSSLTSAPVVQALGKPFSLSVLLEAARAQLPTE